MGEGRRRAAPVRLAGRARRRIIGSCTPNGVFQQLFRCGGETAATRILVVDDEPALRVALQRALRLEGYDVALAATGGSSSCSTS
jgi:PleD family two-component response regulator